MKTSLLNLQRDGKRRNERAKKHGKPLARFLRLVPLPFASFFVHDECETETRPDGGTQGVVADGDGEEEASHHVDAYAQKEFCEFWHVDAGGEEEDMEEEVCRVPPPPLEPLHATRKPNPGRRFENLLGGGGMYVPPPPVVEAEEEGAGAGGGGQRKKGRGRGGKGKAKAKEGVNEGGEE